MLCVGLYKYVAIANVQMSLHTEHVKTKCPSMLSNLLKAKTYDWYTLAGAFLDIPQFCNAMHRDGWYKLHSGTYCSQNIAALCHQIK